jgi:uncharacterized membrane protein
MTNRAVVLLLILGIFAACPASAGTDDQKQEQVVARPPTHDGLRFCNLSGQAIDVAKATFSATRGSNESFVSEGWYKFAPGECRVLWPGKLQYRYYLVYAQNKEAGREWKGDIPVCVEHDAFTIKSPICRPDQYQRLFMQIDTGGSENWTHNLRP